MKKLLFLLILLNHLSFGQTKPKLFINCQQARCYETFLQMELSYFTFARDQALADIQILITDQRNAGGGVNYQLNFIGQNNFEGQDCLIEFKTEQDDVEDQARKKLLNKINQGLIQYLAHTLVLDDAIITFPKGDNSSRQKEEKDPWNDWIFGINANGRIDGESNRKQTRLASSFRGGRTTDKSKFNFNTYFNQNLNSVTVNEQVETAKVNSYGFNSLYVTSLNRSISLGGFIKGYHSVYSNIDFSSSIAPAIEYSVFSIEDFNKEQFRWIYQAGYRRLEYLETTIFDKDFEGRPYHQLTSILGYTKPWGNFSAEMNGYQYLDIPEQYRVSLELELNWRIHKGISLNFYGSGASIRNQISLPRAAGSSEQVLLGATQLPTSFDFFTSFGLNYTFGSVNNSIVNPRFNGVN